MGINGEQEAQEPQKRTVPRLFHHVPFVHLVAITLPQDMMSHPEA